MANPTLTPFPTPPLPEQDEVTFNRNAANSLLAQANFVTEGNIVITWMGQQIDAAAASKKAAADSATAAGQAVTDAQSQVKLATDQAVASKGSAESAAGSLASVKVVASAVDAAAGLPPGVAPGSVLRQKPDGSGQKEWWNLVVTQVGDTVVSTQAPDANWVPTGTTYLQSLFPALFAKLGKIPDFKSDQVGYINRTYGYAWNITGVAAGAGQIFMAGYSPSQNAYMWYVSVDNGLTFSEYSRQSGSYYSYAVAYGNNTFVSFDFNGSQVLVYTTTTGVYGYLNVPGGTNGWFSAAFGNNTFVAVSQSNSTNNTVRSTDNGKTWTVSSLPTDVTPGKLIFSNGMFVLFMGINSNYYYTSVDGATWTKRSLFMTTPIQYDLVAATNNVICIVIGSTSYISKDGITWTNNGGNNPFVQDSLYRLQAGDGIFLLTTPGSSTNSNYNKMYFSQDGLKWTLRNQQLSATNGSLNTAGVYLNGYFIVTGSNSGYWARIKAYSYNNNSLFYASDPIPNQVGLTQYIRGA